MNLNIRVYSVDPKAFKSTDIKRIKEVVKRTKGVNITSIEIVKIKAPSPTITPQGKIDWGWFTRNITVFAPEHNVVVFHFPTKYKRTWKMSKTINGTYRNDPDTVLEFWMSCDKNKKAKGYKNKETETCRLFLHELLHGLKRKTGGNSDDVHTYDYVLKDVAVGYYTIQVTN